MRIGQEYARRSRLELDIDEPSIETLQTLMLLSQASFQLGQGKKTFMLLSMLYHYFCGSPFPKTLGLTLLLSFGDQHGICA